MIHIALLGFGTVGAGVYETLKINEALITERAAQHIKVTRILDRNTFEGTKIADLVTSDYEEILADTSISIVIEMLGGVEPAYEFSKRALLCGKSVITSNKAVVAQYGAELLKIAVEQKVNYLFEASVGGGIPLIRPLVEVMLADEIIEITGILNGTTNFILSQIAEYGKSFAEALKLAQDLGYAEADPTADVDAHDTCRKIAILASLVSKKNVDFEAIKTTGIRMITPEDLAIAHACSYTLKLIGTAKMSAAGISASAQPAIMPLGHPLANVGDVFNAVLVKGNISGDILFYGSGAGKMQTASSVVNDIISSIRKPNFATNYAWSQEPALMVDMQDTASRFFLIFDITAQPLAQRLLTTHFDGGSTHVLEPIFAHRIAFTTSALCPADLEQILKVLALENLSLVSKYPML